ncbi:uncharacterized protein TNCV_3245861 [Trichonephila clavipes]|nr:uncharacterized protein TNCV_3245861 [Trichonephila clavipes]
MGRPKRLAGSRIDSTGSLLDPPQKSKEHIISTCIDKYTAMTQKTKSFGKPWETLTNVGPIPWHLERAEAVAHLRLTTGHDFLGVYLLWLGVAAN